MDYIIIKNNLKELRLKSGLNQTELAEDINNRLKVFSSIGARQRLISNIELGIPYFGPYYIKNGKIRPWVFPICEILNSTIKEIWPVQFEEKIKESEKPFCMHQILDITNGYHSTNTSRNSLEDHLCIMSLLDRKLNKKQKDFMIRHFILDETLDSIGQSYKLTRERVRQIIGESIEKLKKMY
jgi:hypothetical protein